MKTISILPLLGISISPALSQPGATVSYDLHGETLPTSTAEIIPFACSESNILVVDQLAKIKYLQSKNIPITADLAGYLFAVVKGRKLLGCANSNPFNSSTSTSTQNLSKRSSSEQALMTQILCKPTIALTKTVMEQIAVLEEYGIVIPDYLAGWFGVTKDADNFLDCGLKNLNIAGTVDTSATQ